MKHAGEEARYSTLDGMRGIAAIAVATLHIPHFTGNWHLANSFLAVDLFFVLSGFVLAKVYEPRFAADMGALAFLKQRFIRLFPFYALGTALGVLVAIAALRFGGSGLKVEWSAPMLATSLPLSALMVPTPPLWPNDLLYPLNTVLWSIFFELVANLVYALTWPVVRSTRALLLVTGGLALILCGFVAAGISLDGGFNWGSFGVGTARVGFSFFAGVILARLASKRSENAGLALALVAALPLLLALDGGPIYQLGCIILAFPTLVAAASRIEPSRTAASWFEVLGLCSYPMYALHKPVYQLTLGALVKAFPVAPQLLAPWIALVFLVLLAAACYALSAVYDVPLRRWLSGRVRMPLRA